MNYQKILDNLPAPLLLSVALFCVFPAWPAALVIVASLSFTSFKDFLKVRKTDDRELLNEEIKKIKNQIEAIQISRSMGR